MKYNIITVCCLLIVSSSLSALSDECTQILGPLSVFGNARNVAIISATAATFLLYTGMKIDSYFEHRNKFIGILVSGILSIKGMECGLVTCAALFIKYAYDC